jgi:hypothetical protein
MTWYETFDSVFFLSITTAILGTIALCSRTLYKSKCGEVSVCGWLYIKRDTAAEEDIDIAEQGRDRVIGMNGQTEQVG